MLGATEKRSEIEEAINSIRAELKTIKPRREQRSDVIDALQPTEWSL